METKKALRKKLTKTLVDGLKAQAKEYTVLDTDVPRFCVRVYSTGRKTYMVRQREGGRQRWASIGWHGNPWTVEEAREAAKRILGEASRVKMLRETAPADANIRSPFEQRDWQRSAPTLAEFAQRYLEEHAIPHKGADTVSQDRSLLGLRLNKKGEPILPPHPESIVGRLGAMRMDRLDTADVVAFHLRKRETPTRANRCLALLSHMATKAEEWGIRPRHSNPVEHVARFPEVKRERYLSADEMQALGSTLEDAEIDGILTPYGLAAIRLLILTGARCSEILRLKWKDVEGDSLRMMRKGRKATLQLPPQAHDLLKELPHGEDGNPFVIAGLKRGQRLTLSGLEQVWQEVRKAAGLEDVRLHDLRHSFASVAVSAGESLPMIGAILGHTNPSTTQRYAHLAPSPVAAATKATATTIAEAMATKKLPKKKRADVLPMKRKAR